MKTTHDDGVLERNVSTLLESGGERPRISDGARARIRAELIATHGVAGARSWVRSPVFAVGVGLAATAAAALIVTRVVGGAEAPLAGTGETADGSSWIAEPGAKVTQLGPRRLRVEGAALIDVAPGKGVFVVETARGRIEVLGTRFVVDAGAERTSAAVIRGLVKLATADGEVLLHAGEQAVAEPGRPPSRGPAPRLTSLVSWARAARKRDEHAVQPVRNGTLFARDPNNPSVPESPLPIAKLGVDVVVEDQVARVAIDQTFHNPATMVMEGMYRFAVPPDASLQRLAMYVNGQLTESAVVERMHARRIYEDIVYRQLDPALLEWAGTGRLSLRVYPLPPREDKRLLLAYTQSLPKLYDDWTLSVPLPEVDLPVGELAFDVRVRGCANCEVTSPSHKVEVARTGDDAVVSYRERGARIGDSLVLHVRDARRQPVIAAHTEPDGRYLLVRARPELARPAKSYRPRTWVILDDVSASRGPMELRAQADLVDGFLRELDEDDRVSVIAFDVSARTRLAPTRVRDVDRTKLRTALKDEGGVGATSLAAALAEATKQLAGVAPADATIVYLGDGVITTGPSKLDALRAQLANKAQFVGVGVGDGPDIQTLEALAAATGGYATTLDLADDLGWRAFDLVAALHTPRVTGLEARLVDASGVLVPATVYVKARQLADGEELELVAKLAGDGTPTEVIVTGRIDGAPWQQSVAVGDPHAGAYLPRLWAQRHVMARLLEKHDPVAVPPCTEPTPVARATRAQAPVKIACATEGELRELRDEAIRRDVVALGKKYFLLSRHTSLLVLENDTMYKQYGVAKGAGDTWAPYTVPAKIPVVPWVPTGNAPSSVAADAVLVRSPLQVFYNPGSFDDGDRFWDNASLGGRWRGLEDARRSSFVTSRSKLEKADSGSPLREHSRRDPRDGGGGRGPQLFFEEAEANPSDRDWRFAGGGRLARSNEEQAQQGVITTDELADFDGHGAFQTVIGGIGHGSGTGTGFGFGSKGKTGKSRRGPLVAQRYGDPADPAFDDLTALITALFPDAADAIRGDLESAAAGKNTHPIDDGARDLLARARHAMPTGVYRWGDHEIAIDSARRLGWRWTTGADLVETASYDGATWLRRYPELGIDVTRTLSDDDVALALAYLPLWIAEPAHYARWFEVRLKSAREVTLSRAPVGKHQQPQLAYVLVFDDANHLVAIRDGGGDELLTITWGVAGPTAARASGAEIMVGFIGQAIGDASAWAHGATPAGVVVEMPGHLAKLWEDKLGALAAGSPAWRHAQRQRMVALAAVGSHPALYSAYEALRTNGGVELGDLVLASGGIAAATTDEQQTAALAPLKTQPVARYLAAGRIYGKAPAPDRMKPQVTTGALGALWTLRQVTALLASGGPERLKLAVDRLVALGDRAFDLRLLGAAHVGHRHDVKPADTGRAWDTVAIGEYRNVVRASAAHALANRGAYDAAADRVAALVADLDLRAAPPDLTILASQVQNSRRGPAGWQLMWSMWRDRVLAADRYEHVMALMPVASQHPADVQTILARAVQLASGEPDRIVEVAHYASSVNLASWAQSLVEPLVKTHPTRELHQLMAQLMSRQGRTADALAHLEAAQTAGDDEPVALSTVRNELRELLQMSRQLAVQSAPGSTARTAAIERATTWAKRWRMVDPGNPEVDQQLGELFLAVGDQVEAWRQLSSVIERDPMSVDGYQIVADTFEKQGRVAEAVEYWHQALVIDQTNPTHRLRKAQALIALGRAAEGDAILDEIVTRRWHARWAGIAYQARSLLDRGKQPR